MNQILNECLRTNRTFSIWNFEVESEWGGKRIVVVVVVVASKACQFNSYSLTMTLAISCLSDNFFSSRKNRLKWKTIAFWFLSFVFFLFSSSFYLFSWFVFFFVRSFIFGYGELNNGPCKACVCARLFARIHMDREETTTITTKKKKTDDGCFIIRMLFKNRSFKL